MALLQNFSVLAQMTWSWRISSVNSLISCSSSLIILKIFSATWGIGLIVSMACSISRAEMFTLSVSFDVVSMPRGSMSQSQLHMFKFRQQVKNPPVSDFSIWIFSSLRNRMTTSTVRPPMSRHKSVLSMGPTRAPPAINAFNRFLQAPSLQSALRKMGRPVDAYFSGSNEHVSLTGSDSSRWTNPPTPASSS